MEVDCQRAMNFWLIYRFLYDAKLTFREGLVQNSYEPDGPYYEVRTVKDVEAATKDYIAPFFEHAGETALMLSGGVDSAILASYVPKGTVTYTMTDGGNTSEVDGAQKYAKKYGLHNEVVATTWADYQEYAPLLMRQKGAPIHSIEVQIYKIALHARKNGFKNLLFGERADQVFGGHTRLYSRDWTLEEFFEGYAFVNPFEVLANPLKLDGPMREFTDNKGMVDVYGFINKYQLRQSVGGYINACSLAKINFLSPYNKMRLMEKLDTERIRRGDSKYLIRELFKERYEDFETPEKVPMPRAVDEYLADWRGPTRPEFLSNIDISKLTGDKKWYVYCLEWFLNLIEEVE